MGGSVVIDKSKICKLCIESAAHQSFDNAKVRRKDSFTVIQNMMIFHINIYEYSLSCLANLRGIAQRALVKIFSYRISFIYGLWNRLHFSSILRLYYTYLCFLGVFKTYVDVDPYFFLFRRHIVSNVIKTTQKRETPNYHVTAHWFCNFHFAA